MSDSSKLRQQLEGFGLSGKQAEIYLLLVLRGELRVQEIVTLSHIPRSSVYENLRQLYELGLAEEIIDDNFKKVRAYPIGVMRHNLDEKIVDLQQRIHDLAALEKAIDIAAAPGAGITHVRYYKGRTGARQLYWNTLKASYTVYVYSEWGRQKYVGLKFYENFASENRNRGLTEKVLINLNSEILETIKRHTLTGSPMTRTRIEDIRVIDAKTVRIKGDTMIYNDIYAQAYLQNVEIHGFEIESHDFVETQRSIFETLWQMAKPITDFL